MRGGIEVYQNLTEIKTRIPRRAAQIIDELVKKGYFSSLADFARQSILDKLINDFEIGISELEPDIIERKQQRKSLETKRKLEGRVGA